MNYAGVDPALGVLPGIGDARTAHFDMQLSFDQWDPGQLAAAY